MTFRPIRPNDAVDVDRLLSADADAMTPLSDAEANQIWASVMKATSAPSTGHRRSSSANVVARREHPHLRMGAWASVLAAAMLLISIVGGAWLSRDGTERTGPSRFAAVPLASATAIASPYLWWMEPYDSSECPVEGWTSDEYIDAILATPQFSDRQYDIVGSAPREDATDLIETFRVHEACEVLAQFPSPAQQFETPFFVAVATSEDGRIRSGQTVDDLTAASDTIAETYPGDAYERDVLILEEPAPEFIQLAWERTIELDGTPGQGCRAGECGSIPYRSLPTPMGVLDPENALLLEDGRILIGWTEVYFADDPFIDRLDERVQREADIRTFQIFMLIDGEWFLDERLLICRNDCYAMASPTASPVVTAVD